MESREFNRKAKKAAEIMSRVPDSYLDKVIGAAMVLSGGKASLRAKELAGVLKPADRETRKKIIEQARKVRAELMV